MSDIKKQSDDERREYFRIDDAVRLSVKRIPDEELEERISRLEKNLSGGFSVMSSLASISAEMAASMHRVEQMDPDLACYLKAIDKKIEILGRAFLAQESDLSDEQATPVNLSAGGVSLGVNEKYEENQPVEVKMLLFPSFTGILTYGTVVDCIATDGAESGYTYRMRVEFTHMSDQDRDIVIRHVIRRQSSSLRRRD